MNLIAINLRRVAVAGSLVALVTGCSTIKEAKLSASTPKEAISEVENMKRELILNHTDALAPDDFADGRDALEEAKEELSEQEEAAEVMSLAGQAKAYFQRARKTAQSHSEVPNRVLEARKAALTSGLMNSKALRSKLAEADEELRDESDEYTEALDNDEFTALQKRYLNLEVEGAQYKELNMVQQVISRAASNGAEDKATETYRKAVRNKAAAGNLIASNVNTPAKYKDSVATANKSAKLLDDVMAKIKKMGDDTSEKVALKLVQQDRKIGKLSENIGDLSASLGATSMEAAVMGDMLKSQNDRLSEASSKVQFQQAMDEARKQFKSNEAAVYQQGQDLIIRLKNINFATGSAKIPSDSMDLLSKVNNVVSKVDAEKVMVQGHTDSTGPADLNRRLSKKRAKSVASYLTSTNSDMNVSSKGYGASKPLASNSTKEGRSQNRRVDIVIKAKK